MSTVFLHSPEMEDMARDISGWLAQSALGAIERKTFEDGNPDIQICNVEALRGNDVVYVAWLAPETLFGELAILSALSYYRVRSLTIVLPYFPTATKDRIGQAGDIVTAKTLARLLSNIPAPQSSKPAILIYDIHDTHVLHYFGENVVPWHESAIPLLKARLAGLPDTDVVSIAFPDEGAWKRFGKMFGEFSHIICEKRRDGDRRLVTIKEGDPVGRHVVIVDDLAKTAGTILECGTALVKSGAERVSASVTHGVFPQGSWKKFIGAGFTKVWMSDSCPRRVQAVRGLEPFEILPLAPAIARVIKETIHA